MVKMNNKMIALCSMAVGAVYITGFTMTEPTPTKAQTLSSLSSGQQVTSNVSTSQNQGGGNSPKVTVPKTSVQKSNTQTTGTSSGSSPKAQVKSTSKAASSTASPKTSKPATPATAKVSPSTQSKSTQSKSTQPKSTPAAPQNKIYKDGTFTGAGSAWNGTVQVAVTTKNDKITDVQITNCTTSYSESDIASLPQEVVAKQGSNIAFVSGATESSQDFQQAVEQALAQAKL